MAWLCVNKDGTELISPVMPIRDLEEWNCYSENVAGWHDDYGIKLPKGTIKKLIGKDLTWEDFAVKIKED